MFDCRQKSVWRQRLDFALDSAAQGFIEPVYACHIVPLNVTRSLLFTSSKSPTLVLIQRPVDGLLRRSRSRAHRAYCPIAARVILLRDDDTRPNHCANQLQPHANNSAAATAAMPFRAGRLARNTSYQRPDRFPASGRFSFGPRKVRLTFSTNRQRVPQ